MDEAWSTKVAKVQRGEVEKVHDEDKFASPEDRVDP